MASVPGRGRDGLIREAPVRAVGRQGALFLSLGAVIGSGWLFASLDSAQITGGSAVVSWVLAACLVLPLAGAYAELGTSFPVDGGTGRYPLFAFGRVTGAASGFTAWLATVCVPPIETVLSLSYASHFLPWLVSRRADNFGLTPAGFFVAAAVLLAFTLVNFGGVRLFSETNSAVVIFKVAVPVVVIVTILVLAFHPSNFVSGGGFTPDGVHGILVAVTQGGVAFALLGFEQVVELGGETTNPQRNIPWAIFGALVVSTVLYLALQVAFIGAVSPAHLAGGWARLDFHGQFGPYAALLSTLGAVGVAYLVYAAAIVSPGGTGLTYTGTASRMPYALAREGYLPAVFGRLSSRRVPVVSLGVCYTVEVGILLVTRDWRHLISFATAVTALVYAMAPLTLGVLRRIAPDHRRPYRLPWTGVLGPIGFIVAGLIMYWSGWDSDRVVLGAVVAFGLAIGLLAISRRTYRRHAWEWRASGWLLVFALGLGALSYLGRFGGGRGVLSSAAEEPIVAGFCLAVYFLGRWLGVTAHRRMPAGQRPIDRWVP